jgi:quinol monooxygenase YgiN
MSVTIEAGAKLFTLINVFEVRPAKQQNLIDFLNRASAELGTKHSGFISFSIHRSLDGARVVTYSQWASREALEAVLSNPGIRKYMDKAMRLATNIPIFCQVAAVYENQE